MASQSRQFQPALPGRFEMRTVAAPALAACNDTFERAGAGQAIPAQGAGVPLASEPRLPASPLSVSSWYAISGTAMA